MCVCVCGGGEGVNESNNACASSRAGKCSISQSEEEPRVEVFSIS